MPVSATADHRETAFDREHDEPDPRVPVQPNAKVGRRRVIQLATLAGEDAGFVVPWIPTTIAGDGS